MAWGLAGHESVSALTDPPGTPGHWHFMPQPSSSWPPLDQPTPQPHPSGMPLCSTIQPPAIQLRCAHAATQGKRAPFRPVTLASAYVPHSPDPPWPPHALHPCWTPNLPQSSTSQPLPCVQGGARASAPARTPPSPPLQQGPTSSPCSSHTKQICKTPTK